MNSSLRSLLDFYVVDEELKKKLVICLTIQFYNGKDQKKIMEKSKYTSDSVAEIGKKFFLCVVNNECDVSVLLNTTIPEIQKLANYIACRLMKGVSIIHNIQIDVLLADVIACALAVRPICRPLTTEVSDMLNMTQESSSHSDERMVQNGQRMLQDGRADAGADDEVPRVKREREEQENEGNMTMGDLETVKGVKRRLAAITLKDEHEKPLKQLHEDLFGNWSDLPDPLCDVFDKPDETEVGEIMNLTVEAIEEPTPAVQAEDGEGVARVMPVPVEPIPVVQAEMQPPQNVPRRRRRPAKRGDKDKRFNEPYNPPRSFLLKTGTNSILVKPSDHHYETYKVLDNCNKRIDEILENMSREDDDPLGFLTAPQLQNFYQDLVVAPAGTELNTEAGLPRHEENGEEGVVDSALELQDPEQPPEPQAIVPAPQVPVIIEPEPERGVSDSMAFGLPLAMSTPVLLDYQTKAGQTTARPSVFGSSAISDVSMLAVPHMEGRGPMRSLFFPPEVQLDGQEGLQPIEKELGVISIPAVDIEAPAFDEVAVPDPVPEAEAIREVHPSEIDGRLRENVIELVGTRLRETSVMTLRRLVPKSYEEAGDIYIPLRKKRRRSRKRAVPRTEIEHHDAATEPIPELVELPLPQEFHQPEELHQPQELDQPQEFHQPEESHQPQPGEQQTGVGSTGAPEETPQDVANTPVLPPDYSMRLAPLKAHLPSQGEELDYFFSVCYTKQDKLLYRFNEPGWLRFTDFCDGGTNTLFVAKMFQLFLVLKNMQVIKMEQIGSFNNYELYIKLIL